MKREMRLTRTKFMEKWHDANEYKPKAKDALNSVNEAIDALKVYAETTAKAVDENVKTECLLGCLNKYLDTLHETMKVISFIEHETCNSLENSKD